MNEILLNAVAKLGLKDANLQKKVKELHDLT